jgi:hypothetical protein
MYQTNNYHNHVNIHIVQVVVVSYIQIRIRYYFITLLSWLLDWYVLHIGISILNDMILTHPSFPNSVLQGANHKNASYSEGTNLVKRSACLKARVRHL